MPIISFLYTEQDRLQITSTALNRFCRLLFFVIFRDAKWSFVLE